MSIVFRLKDMPKVCTVSNSNTSSCSVFERKSIMSILVIGGTNFMGPLVVRSLSNDGHEVVVFHRGKTSTNLPSGVREILGDRRPLAPFAGELRRFEPDIVLDMIPVTEQDAQEVMSTFKGIAR